MFLEAKDRLDEARRWGAAMIAILSGPIVPTAND